jgi:hypothetical protein
VIRLRAGLALSSVVLSACTSAAGGIPPSTTTLAAPELPPAAEDSEPTLPDVTARPITGQDLTAMLPSGTGGVAVSTEEPVFEERTNEHLITAAVLDRDDEIDDIERSGRITGVGARYSGPDHDSYVWIDVFEEAGGARDWLNDTTGDITKRLGGSHRPDIALIAADDYPIEGVGDNAIGLVLEIEVDGRVLHETLVTFTMGRIVAFASHIATEPIDARVPAQYLAEEVEQRILDVLLQRTPEPSSRVGPSGYRFDHRQVVTIEGTQWPTTAEGIVHGSDVSCRVRLDRPDGTADREFIVVDGRVWSRPTGQGDYVESPSAAVLDRTLLTFCPLWSIDPFEAGLGGVTEGTPARHEVGGVPALGYRGTTADLGTALGGSAGDVVVDVFNVWISEGTGWLVELDISLTGEAADLAALVGPGYPGGTTQVSMRYRVSDLENVDAVQPPG